MLLVRPRLDGADGAVLGAPRAADTIVRHEVLDQGDAFAGRAAPGDVRLVFVAEVPQCRQHRIGGCLSQATEGARLNRLA